MARDVIQTEAGWKSVKLAIEGAPTLKLRGFAFKLATEKDFVRGTGGRPLMIASGNESYTGSIKLLRGDVRRINQIARGMGFRDIRDISFDIILTYAAEGNRGLATDTLVGVEVTEFEQAMEQGDKFMTVDLPIMFLDVVTTDL